ncbi:MAG TPA: hypothetical protein PKL46_20520, partial [Aquabacterium sp.]|nr:hypothetical protein [Aquabacterium sp.]
MFPNMPFRVGRMMGVAREASALLRICQPACLVCPSPIRDQTMRAVASRLAPFAFALLAAAGLAGCA